MSDQIVSTLKILKKLFPNPGAMEIGSPYQNLVAVMLSARTRDEQVLKLLPGFWKAFPSVEKLAKAQTSPHPSPLKGEGVTIESKINTIGMYKQKAKNLKKMALDVVEKFDGKIPSTMEELVSLAGVGRKTASVILAISFDKPAIAVDTHVFRVTNRLGWIRSATVEDAERKLLELVPSKYHQTVNRVFVKLGRYICIRSPRCWACPVRDLCAYKHKNLTLPKNAKEILEDIDRREDILNELRRQAVK